MGTRKGTRYTKEDSYDTLKRWLGRKSTSCQLGRSDCFAVAKNRSFSVRLSNGIECDASRWTRLQGNIILETPPANTPSTNTTARTSSGWVGESRLLPLCLIAQP